MDLGTCEMNKKYPSLLGALHSPVGPSSWLLQKKQLLQSGLQVYSMGRSQAAPQRNAFTSELSHANYTSLLLSPIYELFKRPQSFNLKYMQCFIKSSFQARFLQYMSILTLQQSQKNPEISHFFNN